GDVAPADNADTVTAYTGPDLYIEKQHSGGQAAPGEYITFTVEFGNANQGPWNTSAGTHLTETLPAGMTFITATVPGDPGQPWQPETVDGNTVVWAWGGMGANDTRFFDLVVQIDPAANSGDALMNTIALGSDNPAQDLEYDDANNTASATIVVESLYRIYLPMMFKSD
ncbi:MAG TPA: hypothetical protein VLC52_09405, partial [Anaerolineae bacterium]|nr:hypothetical protein [Anaerolineae bacterium]